MHGDARGRREGMNRIVSATVVAAAVGCITFSAEAKIEVSETTGFDAEHSWFRYTPYTKYRDMSGITWAGGNKFYVIRNNNYLSVMTVSLDDHGNLTALPSMTEGYPLEGASDPEGIAYDNASGKVWVSDETGPTIREYDPVNRNANGKFVPTGREVRIPAILKKIGEQNRSLESLTISGDGLVMWTANEEALADDTYSDGVVRLVKFVRKTVQSEWSLAGMWAYECDRGGRTLANGVADLLSLPDGSLVVLERAVEPVYYGSCRLHKVDFSNATDVTNVNSIDRSAITDGSVKLAGKSRLLCICEDGGSPEKTHIYDCDGYGTYGYMVACYEGICLGPKNKDGSYNIMLVSDGGSRSGSVFMQPFVRALKLTGLDIHTLSVNKPAQCGDQTFYGQNYRFVHNATVTNELYGEGFDPRAYTNQGDIVYSSTWTLPAHGKSCVAGRRAVFKIVADDVLTWNVSQTPGVVTSSPYYAHDTFEEYAHGTHIAGLNRWAGDGEVIACTYTPSNGKYIFKGVEHKKVLDAEDGATKAISPKISTTSKNRRVDMMVEVRCPRKALEAPTGDPVVAIAADKDGYLNVWHRGGYYGSVTSPHWSRLSNTKFTNGTWVRVGLELYFPQSGRGFAHVRLNGGNWLSVPGGNTTQAVRTGNGSGDWFPLSESASAPNRLAFNGTKVDDLVVATPTYIAEIDASASVMVAPSAASGANGAAAAGGHAYTVATAVAAPAVATANAEGHVAVPVITGFGIVPGGCPSIRFRGYAEGVGYRVVRSTSVDFKPANCEYPEGEITSVSGDEAVWEGSEPDDPSSGAKFYRVEAIAK